MTIFLTSMIWRAYAALQGKETSFHQVKMTLKVRSHILILEHNCQGQLRLERSYIRHSHVTREGEGPDTTSIQRGAKCSPHISWEKKIGL